MSSIQRSLTNYDITMSSNSTGNAPTFDPQQQMPVVLSVSMTTFIVGILIIIIAICLEKRRRRAGIISFMDTDGNISKPYDQSRVSSAKAAMADDSSYENDEAIIPANSQSAINFNLLDNLPEKRD